MRRYSLSMNRASARAKCNSGRYGGICFEIFPFSVDCERLMKSFRIVSVYSSFQRWRSFRACASYTLTLARTMRYAATRQTRKARAIMMRLREVIVYDRY
jgi:hypothetical protein